MKISLYKYSEDFLSKFFVKDKINIIIPMGILSILMVVNYMTKKYLGIYAFFIFGFLLAIAIYKYVNILRLEYFLENIGKYNNLEIIFSKNQNIVQISYIYKDKSFKKVFGYLDKRCEISNKDTLEFDILKNTIVEYVNESNKINIAFKKTPKDIVNSSKKKVFRICLVFYFILLLEIYFLTKSLIVVTLMVIPWFLIFAMLGIIFFMKTREKYNIDVFKNNDLNAYLKNGTLFIVYDKKCVELDFKNNILEEKDLYLLDIENKEIK